MLCSDEVRKGNDEIQFSLSIGRSQSAVSSTKEFSIRRQAAAAAHPVNLSNPDGIHVRP
jgi:hypothetical protein